MSALTQETMRVERVNLTPEQREERRHEAGELGIKIRRASDTETTMPAQAVTEPNEVTVRSTTPRSTIRAVCTAPPRPAGMIRQPEALGATEVPARSETADQRTAELEQQLAAALVDRDTAERRVAQLQDLNQELAVDLDNALDQLAGHALHAEQERLIRTPAWSPWAASADREGGGFER